MNIAFGSDHAGFEDPPPHYKPALIAYLEGHGHRVVDCGTEGPDAVDYPDIAEAVSAKVLSGDVEAGVLLCGTGIGMSITANRHKGIRAAVCTTPEMARLSRQHNHANILCIGRRVLSLDECKAILDAWFEEPYSDVERHKRRVTKMG